MIYSTGYTSEYFTTEFHFVQHRSHIGVGNYLAKTLHQFIRISSYHMQEMWSGCWILKPLTTPPIKFIPHSHCSQGSGPCLLVLNPFPVPTAYLTESFQTCLYLYTDKSTLTGVCFYKFFSAFLEKLEYFQFLATDQGQRVATLAVFRRFGNRRLHHACLRFVSQLERLFPRCLAVSPFLFCFILFSVKII